MNFALNGKDASSKFSKIAIVAGLHLVCGAALISHMATVKRPVAQPEPTFAVLPTPKSEPAKIEPLDEPTEILPPKHEVYMPDVVIEQQTKVINDIAVTTNDEPKDDTIIPTGPTEKVDTGEAVAATEVKKKGIGKAEFAKVCGMPEYPAKALRNGETGTVSLALLIRTDGQVASSRIQGSSGSRELDRAAQEALSLCNFKPATNNGVPEQAWAQLAYVWKLD
jgi:protein TonB